MGSSVVGPPHIAESETPHKDAPPKSRETAFSGLHTPVGRSGVKITMLIVVLLSLATASGAAMIVSVKKEPVLLACGGPNC
jgi:hypothetical protein